MIGRCQSPSFRHRNGCFFCCLSNIGKISAFAVIQHHIGQKMEVRVLVILVVMATDNELVKAIAMPFQMLYPISNYFFGMNFKHGRVIDMK